MELVLNSLADLARLDADTLIDVRTPAEYAEDHVPGALSLPVLDNAEHARIGTIYKEQSPFLARKLGAALVARNAARHIEGPLAGQDGAWKPLVYCWRGGQRSNSFASILSQIGWRVGVIEGGYRSFRRLVNAQLYDAAFPCPVVLLDGNTGTAKTALLHLAAERGVQVLDLEGLARHRGSLFGAVAGAQPSQKAFETALAMKIIALDPARPVLVEAESSKVGARNVPPGLWRAMQHAGRIEMAAPVAARARYLTTAYRDIVADPARLSETLDQLRSFQGHARVAAWHTLAIEGDFETLAAELMVHHYDPRYGRHRGTPAILGRIEAARLDDQGLARAADEIVAMLGLLPPDCSGI